MKTCVASQAWLGTYFQIRLLFSQHLNIRTRPSSFTALEATARHSEGKYCAPGSHLVVRPFAGMRFVFPTAQKRRSSAFKRATINQWFDMASLDDHSKRRELQIDGLTESAKHIRYILEQEASHDPSAKHYFGGLESRLCHDTICLLLILNNTAEHLRRRGLALPGRAPVICATFEVSDKIAATFSGQTLDRGRKFPSFANISLDSFVHH